MVLLGVLLYERRDPLNVVFVAAKDRGFLVVKKRLPGSRGLPMHALVRGF